MKNRPLYEKQSVWRETVRFTESHPFYGNPSVLQQTVRVTVHCLMNWLDVSSFPVLKVLMITTRTDWSIIWQHSIRWQICVQWWQNVILT
jgi:hypothetical protein